MTLILIVGKKQAGKTTAAEALTQYISNDVRFGWLIAERFSFADSLKRFCIENDWINYTQAYGTNEEKNSLSKLNWKNFGFLEQCCCLDQFLTAREVLQIIGTDVMRSIDEDIWVNRCLYTIGKSIEGDSIPDIAIIDDGRFPNEVKKIKENDGIVIYLTRTEFSDCHSSEKDVELIDKSNFDYIIENQNFTKEQLKNEICSIGCKILENKYGC